MYKKTGKFASTEQLTEVAYSYNLAFNTPAMATLPGGKVPAPKEDFRDMATRFAIEAGLIGDNFAIDPDTREFFLIKE